MTIISGVLGSVDGAEAVGKWSISHTANIQALVASNTQGMEVVLEGNKDWPGSYEAFGPQPAYMPGEGFTFIGSIDEETGTNGAAVVDSVEIVFDFEGGLPIKHTVNFSANSDLTIGAAVSVDTGQTALLSSIGCTVSAGTAIAVPVYSEITDVRTVTITITAGNTPYVSSSTAGSTRRLAGNLSVAIAVSVFEDSLADLPVLNAEHALKITLSAATFWEFIWVRVADTSDIDLDVMTAALLGATINYRYTGFITIATVLTQGSIVMPDTNDFWPAP